MFKCKKCNRLSAPGEKTNNVILETRPKTYSFKKGEKDIVIGQGTEIVREIRVCGKCVPKAETAA